MLKILWNEDTQVPRDRGSLKLSFDGMYVKAEILDNTGNLLGFDVVRSLRSYASYVLVHKEYGTVKVFRKIHKSDYKFLDLSRLGVDIRMDFADIIQLYSDYAVLQIDTGIISPTRQDIIVRVFRVHKDEIQVDAVGGYEFAPYSSKALETGDHPRFHLWDSYALEVNGRMLKANRKGLVMDGDFVTPVVSPSDHPDYIDLVIHKYQGNFDGDALTREEDCEEVMIQSSAGLLNATRVRLDHGMAKVRLYPFGFTGEIKIKLGRRWYEVWNEYNLILGANQ